MMDMPPLMLCLKNVDGFLLSNRSRSLRLVLEYEGGERFPNDQANIQRKTGILHLRPARTIQGHNVIGIRQ